MWLTRRRLVLDVADQLDGPAQRGDSGTEGLSGGIEANGVDSGIAPHAQPLAPPATGRRQPLPRARGRHGQAPRHPSVGRHGPRRRPAFGGLGFARELGADDRPCPIEALYRDSKIGEIYEGTNEIQKWVIARQIFGRDITG
ncbi:acyl-CoA dehydrogenase family protein [Streptomyces sp. NPDC102259]|uniref:acyl-CoA dehydrogenase family protein n=1 Tax=Streptomyces sp. NPDC102259 TaxID=3366148 RepID=UPI00382BC203